MAPSKLAILSIFLALIFSQIRADMKVPDEENERPSFPVKINELGSPDSWSSKFKAKFHDLGAFSLGTLRNKTRMSRVKMEPLQSNLKLKIAEEKRLIGTFVETTRFTVVSRRGLETSATAGDCLDRDLVHCKSEPAGKSNEVTRREVIGLVQCAGEVSVV
ncbi:hypothetical protein ACFX19_017176 [Malus domestica]